VSRFFRSVGAQLSLALLLVVAVALGIVYLTVVPSLRSRLVDARVTDLERSAARLQREARSTSALDSDRITAWADVTGTRVLLVQPLSGTPIVIDDSRRGGSSKDVQDDEFVVGATRTGRPQHGTVEEDGQHFAEAAVPILRGQYILVLRDSVQNRYGTVALVKRRLVLAAGVALIIALLLGYAGARMFARRIERLERAADRIASGRFDEPVVDTRGDELAALAAAFDRMRVRLAHLDDARRAFVANASHELRTPLFSLGGFLELLDDEELDDATRREFLGSMREQVERLTKLASDLLDLTRLDAGRLTVEREPVDLGALARDLVEEFGPLAASTRHTLTGSFDGAVFAEADELRTLQLGRILVENALLHTPPETAVGVRARRRGDTAVLEVEDAGPGIPPEQRQQLFERFFRLDGARASGSGLGLAIAKELAELMDGAVEVESEPGRTVFTLVLPSAGYPPATISREITPSASA
jgi:two-component system, OmpR family, sensor kinase